MDKHFKKNQSINGYKVTKRLGEGRYGIAYLATNEQSQKVVIKQLKKDMLKETRKKLFYEEKILKSLDHPAIPKFIGKFKEGSTEGYILEYIEGKTFDQLIRRNEEVFTKDEIYHIADQLLDILQPLHEQNIVHRDIRLPNVIVKDNKELALIDFGLARYVDDQRYVKAVDYWYLADFLLHLYYTTYNGLETLERPWYDELDLYDEEEKFLRKLLGISKDRAKYHSIDEIRQDLNKVKQIHQRKKKEEEGINVISEVEIQKIHLKSFRANIYNLEPFRVIGLIDVDVKYSYGIERVTLAFYRSSGTNNGKIKGLWYPIVGIKLETGPFTEFTDYLNHALTMSTRRGYGKKGWLAKSVFFTDSYVPKSRFRGFSNGPHYEPLFEIGKTLMNLYDEDSYYEMHELDAKTLDDLVIEDRILPGNKHTQRENYNRLMADIINGVK
ncbi:serine/threonine protein kinase [Turicibacter sanguinis]|uniref:serine/threonine protein kinase n=1 Tax=Turicibacter sanguinis TaxID=154288 RepID=UPI001E286EF9|nr:protein kinase family protein [Turicibacter sanguinis]MDB8550977.1 protein kinase family protein [Turicibacter sanguinis]